MFWGLLGAAASIRPIGGQVTDRDARDRIRRRSPEAPPEAPNPDFDFGEIPSTVELAKPRAVERLLGRYLLVVGLVAMIPVALLMLLLFGFWR